MPIVRLTPSHAAAYRGLMLDAYASDPDAFTSTAAERCDLALSWWAARVSEATNAKEVVFGAFVEGELAGVAGLSFEVREKTRHKATLFGMVVQAKYRRHGFGRQLVMAVLDHAGRTPDVKLVQLTVTEGNAPAQRLYASCGFVPFGTEPCAVRVGAGYVSKVHMWCRLGVPAG
jgi:RimJ/RimL family protein N-acetyltransferase